MHAGGCKGTALCCAIAERRTVHGRVRHPGPAMKRTRSNADAPMMKHGTNRPQTSKPHPYGVAAAGNGPRVHMMQRRNGVIIHAE